MLIFLPSTPTTEKASAFLTEQGVEHRVIPAPDTLDYQNDSDIAIYVPGNDQGDIPMRLTRARFVVMRVFKDFEL